MGRIFSWADREQLHAYSVLIITIKRSHRVKLLDAADVRGLLGLLLADGSLVPYRTPGGGYIQLTLTSGASESAFLEEKVDEFREFVPTRAEIVPYKTPARANGKRTAILRFRVSTNKLRPIYNLLYPSGERQITQAALDLLGASAAAWCWAEGVRIKKDGSSTLSRVGATEEEARLMARWIEVLTGGTATISTDRVKPRLLYKPEQTKKIQTTLIDYSPKTRRHLFKEEHWDVSTIRSSRTELQFGARQSESEGQKATSMARNL